MSDKIRDLPDSAVAAWVKRHDLEAAFGGSKADARAAFEDARTAHLIEGESDAARAAREGRG